MSELDLMLPVGFEAVENWVLGRPVSVKMHSHLMLTVGYHSVLQGEGALTSL